MHLKSIILESLNKPFYSCEHTEPTHSLIDHHLRISKHISNNHIVPPEAFRMLDLPMRHSVIRLGRSFGTYGWQHSMPIEPSYYKTCENLERFSHLAKVPRRGHIFNQLDSAMLHSNILASEHNETPFKIRQAHIIFPSYSTSKVLALHMSNNARSYGISHIFIPHEGDYYDHSQLYHSEISPDAHTRLSDIYGESDNSDAY